VCKLSNSVHAFASSVGSSVHGSLVQVKINLLKSLGECSERKNRRLRRWTGRHSV